MKTIGLISDTHGLLRPEAVRALAGVSHIIHAGDIGEPEILDELRKIAPVYAVRGNNDKGGWAAGVCGRGVYGMTRQVGFCLAMLSATEPDLLL